MRKKNGARSQTQPNALASETAALTTLVQPGAFARIEGARALLYARPQAVTLAVGRTSPAKIRALVTSGALAEERTPSGARYVITDAGRARLRRVAAGAQGFAAQHGEHEPATPAQDGAEIVFRNAAESPLLWLYRRGGGLIGEAEFAAGERLRSDMTIARTLPRLTADLERPSRSGVAIGLDPSEARVAAVQRVQAALRAIGPEFAGLLMDVCGFLKGLELIERERGWPQRSAKLVLALGLAALARHYGLSNAAIGTVGRRRTHRWAAADYRPHFAVAAEVGATSSA